MLPVVCLIGLQALDALVHVATGQVEPIRLSASALIGLGGVLIVGVKARPGLIASLAGMTYLALNLVFLAQHGLVNPATETIRVPLFVFVMGSLGLLAWTRHRTRG
ncbi:MAG: hypothetical protein AAFX77_04885 [Pseudomonadota bacterium]